MQLNRQNLLKHSAIYGCYICDGLKMYPFATEVVKKAFATTIERKCECCEQCNSRYTCNTLHFKDDDCYGPNGQYIMHRECAGRRAQHDMLHTEVQHKRHGLVFCSECAEYFAKPYAPEGVTVVSKPK